MAPCVLMILFVVIPAIAATLFQVNAWPFEAYPMFSGRCDPHKLRVFRLAYLDGDGMMHWWKPHFYKLMEMFGEEAKICLRLPAPIRNNRLRSLISRIQQCINDDPRAQDISCICIIMRSCQRDENRCWHVVDQLILCRSIEPRISPSQSL